MIHIYSRPGGSTSPTESRRVEACFRLADCSRHVTTAEEEFRFLALSRILYRARIPLTGPRPDNWLGKRCRYKVCLNENE